MGPSMCIGLEALMYSSTVQIIMALTPRGRIPRVARCIAVVGSIARRASLAQLPAARRGGLHPGGIARRVRYRP